MKKVFKNYLVVIALFLCTILTTICFLNPFVPYCAHAHSFVDDWDGLNESEIKELLDNHLSVQGVDEYYINELTDKTTDTFEQYLAYDDSTGHAFLDTSELEEEFATEYPQLESEIGNVYSEGFDDTVLQSQDTIDLLTDALDENPEDFQYKVATVRAIRRNLSLMNALADEELGYINDSYEFVFYVDPADVEIPPMESNSEQTQPEDPTPSTPEDPDPATPPAEEPPLDPATLSWYWENPTLAWNKFSVNMGSGWAIIFSIITLIIHTGLYSFDVLFRTPISNETAIISNTILTGLSAVDDIAAGLVGLASNPLFAIIADVFSYLVQFATQVPFVAIIRIVISILLPSLLDCLIVLYRAIVFNDGVEVTACWIPTWWDKWGFSIKSIPNI